MSPMDLVARVARQTEVVALTGSEDANTTPAVAESYVAKLREHGVPARFVSIPGAAHGFGGVESAVRDEVERVLSR